MRLDPAFLRLPIAHRALHDRGDGRPENSPAAINAAVAAGYAIEIDLQLSADGQAMVFHDYALERLTKARGAVRLLSAAELGQIRFRDGPDTIPTLQQVLDMVAGQVPLLIEIKDQDGAMGANVGALEEATAKALTGYNGPTAVMSFNPHAVAAFAKSAPRIPRGLTTSAYRARDWPLLAANTRDTLRKIDSYDRIGACFISHEANDLARRRVSDLKAGGAAVFCWTIRSAAAEVQARRIADNITFEGYLAQLPAT